MASFYRSTAACGIRALLYQCPVADSLKWQRWSEHAILTHAQRVPYGIMISLACSEAEGVQHCSPAATSTCISTAWRTNMVEASLHIKTGRMC